MLNYIKVVFHILIQFKDIIKIYPLAKLFRVAETYIQRSMLFEVLSVRNTYTIKLLLNSFTLLNTNTSSENLYQSDATAHLTPYAVKKKKKKLTN